MITQGSVFFIRHAAAFRDQSLPRDEWPLTAVGVADASRLVAKLSGHPIEQVISSPARRAVETAKPLVASRRCDFRTDERLRERDFGDGWIDEFDAFVARAFVDRSLREYGAESVDACAARMIAAVEETDTSVPTAFVGHGQAIAACLSGADLAFSITDWRNLRMPDVIILEVTAARGRNTRSAKRGKKVRWRLLR